MAMNYLDIGILIVIAVSAFNGLRQGLIKAVLSFIGLALGISLASRYYTTLAPSLTFISNPTYAAIAAFAIILIAILVVTAVVAAVLTKVASAILLGWLNRVGGAVFGFLVGAVICGVALAVWLKFLGANDLITKSVLAKILLDKLPLVLSFLPKEFDIIRQLLK